MKLNKDKLANLVLHIASDPSVKSLGETKLYKLIFYIDATHLREFGISITGSEYIKYQHGPVPSRGEKIVKRLKREEKVKTERVKDGNYSRNAIGALVEPDYSLFDEDELSTIKKICNLLGGKRATTISDMSHEEPSWVYADKMQKLSPELMSYGLEEDPDGL